MSLYGSAGLAAIRWSFADLVKISVEGKVTTPDLNQKASMPARNLVLAFPVLVEGEGLVDSLHLFSPRGVSPHFSPLSLQTLEVRLLAGCSADGHWMF